MSKSVKKKLASQIARWRQIVAGGGVLLSRFGSLPPNISLVGSFGFFGGNVWAFAATIVIFDLLTSGWYQGVAFTYLGFGSYYLLGKLARGKTRRQLVLLPMASFLFFIVSNLGVWWYWYPHTLAGLAACYLAALPFYQHTLLGDLGFGYGYMAGRWVWRQIQKGVTFPTKQAIVEA